VAARYALVPEVEIANPGVFLTEERVERRLAAVLAADVAGYSRLMGANEEGTLARLKAVRKALVDPAMASHRGRIVKTTGDGMLVEFASAVDAVRSSAELQRGMAEQNVALPQDHRIEFRIGIHVGDIIIDDNDIFGDGVNIAARLEGIAEPGGICISDDAQRQVRGKVDIAFEDMGSQTLKNIAEPMRAWRVQLGPQGTPAAQQVSSANQAPVLALPDKPSIAVLPFQNMSGDPEQEYFADGMVEDIITALSKFKSLFVIARNSSFTYKGKAVDIKQAGRELGVHYVLEGSVRKAGGRVRITGQLIDAATGTHLWADRFEGALDDIFELQDSVTRSVVGAIAPRLIEASEAAAIRKPLERWDSYDHYLRALPLFYQGQGNLVLLIEAQKIFRKIISSDVRFAPAYACLALSILQMKDLHNQSVAEDERTEALRFAEQALSLSSDDETVLARTAFVFALLDGNFERGRALAERATAINPNSAPAWNARATMDLVLGELEAALQGFANVMRLNPLDKREVPFALFGSGAACLLSGKYDESAAFVRRLLLLSPNDIRGLFILTGSALFGGKLAEAEETVARIKLLFPHLRSSQLRQVYRVRKPEQMAIVERTIAGIGLPE
jgi:adenylate cyclase